MGTIGMKLEGYKPKDKQPQAKELNSTSQRIFSHRAKRLPFPLINIAIGQAVLIPLTNMATGQRNYDDTCE